MKSQIGSCLCHECLQEVRCCGSILVPGCHLIVVKHGVRWNAGTIGKPGSVPDTNPIRYSSELICGKAKFFDRSHHVLVVVREDPCTKFDGSKCLVVVWIDHRAACLFGMVESRIVLKTRVLTTADSGIFVVYIEDERVVGVCPILGEFDPVGSRRATRASTDDGDIWHKRRARQRSKPK